jgi:anthranilate phosphoribosyltransferase
MIKEGIQKLTEQMDLSHKESEEIMREIMTGKAADSQIAAFLTALKMKGETVEEITALAKVMKECCHKIHPHCRNRLIDTCGTGGDRIKTFNISTAAAFVVAGAGIAVAKHGNRSFTSQSGSADVLEQLGLNLNMDLGAVEDAIENIGIGFMFAPVFHPAMKFASNTRREIGIRTVFNILGPLTNPANADAQVLGVYNLKLTESLAHVLRNLGCKEAMVVHGLDGLDEISTIGKTIISRLKEDKISTMEVTPEDIGVTLVRPESIGGSTPEKNAEIIFKVLYGCCDSRDQKREIVLVNGVAGIIVGGKAEEFSYGIELARESIDSGAAYKKLKALIKFSRGNLLKLEELELKYA